MPDQRYAAYEVAAPNFKLVRGALGDLVDEEHFFDVASDDLTYEVLFEVPGWPRVIRGWDSLMAQSTSYVRMSLSSPPTIFSFTRQTAEVWSSSSTKFTALSSRRA
jgi:hypothetical protein